MIFLKMKGIIISTAIGSSIFIVLSTITPILNSNTTMNVGNEFFSVTLVETKSPPCCPSDKELIFEVLNKKNKEKKGLLLRGRMSAVKELMLVFGTRLIVIGELPRGGDIILIADVEKCEQVDSVWAYGFSFSPSKRFLIYRTHHPPYIIPEFRKSIILLYDLNKSPRDNRLAAEISFTKQNAGIPIFPEINLTQKSYNPTLDMEHILISPFLWSEDEKKIVFLEFYNESNYLIMIDLSFGIDNVKIARKLINAEDFVNRDIMLDVTKKELEKHPIKLTTKSIRWEGPKKIVVEPYPQYWLDNKITLIVPSVN